MAMNSPFIRRRREKHSNATSKSPITPPYPPLPPYFAWRIATHNTAHPCPREFFRTHRSFPNSQTCTEEGDAVKIGGGESGAKTSRTYFYILRPGVRHKNSFFAVVLTELYVVRYHIRTVGLPTHTILYNTIFIKIFHEPSKKNHLLFIIIKSPTAALVAFSISVFCNFCGTLH